LYLEGNDQYRGWFMSSLLCAIGQRNAAPFRMVATPGWTLDEEGRALSKSRGTDVDPVDIAARMGAEVVRLWVASVDFREDVVGSERLMQRIADNYRKIRNTFRYVLSNVQDFDPEHDSVPFAEMQALDQFMLLRTVELARELRAWYEEFAFHKVYHSIMDFCVVDLSAVYFDVLKDRLYTSAATSRKRRSAQTAIWRIAEALVRLTAPIMSFTADEIWQYLPQVSGRAESVHLAVFPTDDDINGGRVDAAESSRISARWETLLSVRSEALKALEEARNAKAIGSSLEAQVTFLAPDSLYPLLERNLGELRALLIVSAVELKHAAAINGAAALQVQVSRAPGEKCERCWNYSPHVGENSAYPTICERCSEALREIEVA
jgi:isoleucyl-tRNA synthetase